MANALNRLAVEEGISRATLAKWRAEARAKGKLMPEADANVEGWTSDDSRRGTPLVRVTRRRRR
ncbi:hypothetical protein [Mangrovicoccus ximenensis]|uniref:hypothetical protein n=1 Tax=Mangrovicoccus ximenensis TaxID=1911570 RepID=UPI0011AE4465|nr:hypothetical protein [Mangrovicoccus ximenensis]